MVDHKAIDLEGEGTLDAIHSNPLILQMEKLSPREFKGLAPQVSGDKGRDSQR